MPNDIHLQKFLRDPENGSNVLQNLQDQLGVYSKRHSQFPELIQFTYDQIESSKYKDHPVVVESRGIILNSEDNWNIVCRSFDRFFNQGETCAAEIDWSNARVQEKVDGSLMTVYHYNGEWHVCTKGSPDAGGTVGTEQFTFRDLFWETFNRHCNIVLLQGFNYIFELTSEYNRVVTAQHGNKGNLTLIGMRSPDGNEVALENFVSLFPVVQSFPLNSVDDVIEASKNLDPSKQEGFVVVDRKFNRIKIKSPKYVLIHHLKNSLNDERIVALIKTGESSEVFAYFPDLKVRYDILNHKFWYLENLLDRYYNEFVNSRTFENQKEFALFVQKYFKSVVHGYFYQRRLGKVNNAKEWLNLMHDNKVVDLLEVDVFVNPF
jgi:hypothetical protein